MLINWSQNILCSDDIILQLECFAALDAARLPSPDFPLPLFFLKYTDIFILSKGPQSGEGAPGSLGPPSKPRLEEGLKSPKSSSQPCTHLPRAPSPPQLSVPSEHPLSAVLEFVVKGWAPFQRGPQGLEPLKGRQPARVPDRHPSFQPLQSQGG